MKGRDAPSLLTEEEWLASLGRRPLMAWNHPIAPTLAHQIGYVECPACHWKVAYRAHRTTVQCDRCLAPALEVVGRL